MDYLIPIMRKYHRNKTEGHSTVSDQYSSKASGYERQGKTEELS